MSDIKLGFIGAGNMASAIIKSIINSGYIKSEHLYVYDVIEEKANTFASNGITVCKDLSSLVKMSDFVFLCVKPQSFCDVANVISPYLTIDKCVVSIMAGIKISTIKESLEFNPCVIRIMPNTPLLLSMGASALCRSNDVSDDKFNFVFDIFSRCGKAIETDESKISAVTAISGSGPAYFFKFARAAIEQGVELGLTNEEALTLLCQTMRGSADMLELSKKSADDLITMVTSPKGTTLAANESFDKNSFEPIVKEAIKACYDRAVELSGD